jgi:GH24 family phage-related lysozyme (muramidase)|tara:strand:+ start:1196 stop:1384 length:189 start_codon:yes stop_codon:yes gene_type:complete
LEIKGGIKMKKITEEQFEILEHIMNEARKNVTYDYYLTDAVFDGILSLIYDYNKERGYYALD